MSNLRIEDLPMMKPLNAEELEQVLGAGRTVRPGLEKLEGREVPAMLSLSAVGSTFTVARQNLRPAFTVSQVAQTQDLVIRGSNQADNIEVGQTMGLTFVRHGNRTEYHSGQFKRIVFEGRDGNDFFINNTNIPLFARGGLGDDTIIGGSAGDLIFGDMGMDAIAGRGGNDTLFGASTAGGADGTQPWGFSGNWNALDGGQGNDLIYGSTNSDGMSGGTGQDTVFGFGGRNTVGQGMQSQPTSSSSSSGQNWRDSAFGGVSRQDTGVEANREHRDRSGSGFSYQESMQDHQGSDGSQTIVRNEAYKNSDGSTTEIKTTHEKDSSGATRETQVVRHTSSDGSSVTETHETSTSKDGSTQESHTSTSDTDTAANTEASLPAQDGSRVWVNRINTPQPPARTVQGDGRTDPRTINPNPAADPQGGGTVNLDAARQAGLERFTLPGGTSSGVTIRNLPDLNNGVRPLDIYINPVPLNNQMFR